MTTVFEATTRGKKHRVLVTRNEDVYRVERFTSGSSCGVSTGHTKESVKAYLAQMLHYALLWDGINYKVVRDDL